jgi:rsbT antagonist protein RsbS
MALHADIPGVAMQLSRGVVVASIQVDLDDDVLARFREDLLERLHESGSEGVILDVSGLQTLDSEEFAALRRIMTMTSLMGAESVLVGLQPGVVSSLIETGVDVEGLRVAINLDAGFALLEPEPQLEPETETETATEAELDREDDAPLDAETTPESDR